MNEPIFKKGDTLHLNGHEYHTITVAIVYDQDEYDEGFYYRDDSPIRHLHSESWLVENCKLVTSKSN